MNARVDTAEHTDETREQGGGHQTKRHTDTTKSTKSQKNTNNQETREKKSGDPFFHAHQAVALQLPCSQALSKHLNTHSSGER
eukprot:EC851207.1.p2 GENE.EC851207.1~~EC851207.1.p2  ORF type:complete len:83 (-),score=14.81 EC851207.1:145-393(-)